jgi:hypothetical protein
VSSFETFRDAAAVEQAKSFGSDRAMKKDPYYSYNFYMRESSLEVRQCATFSKSQIGRLRERHFPSEKILDSGFTKIQAFVVTAGCFPEGKRTLKEAATHQ